jgi:pimeloyl-ACP methyl ester carboxylesterase
VFLPDRPARLRVVHASGRAADYSPEGHARFYEQVREALALPEVVVLGHSFGATTALTYAALFPESTAMCVAVAAFGIGPDADARRGGEAEAEAEALLARHAGSPWYEMARPVMDSWTERLLAATDAAEMEQMMATVLPFYVAEPDKPEVAAGLAKMSAAMKATWRRARPGKAACTSPLTCARCWAASPAPHSLWPANSTSSAAPRKLSRSPPPSPDPSSSCLRAAATYPASKHPSTTAARSRNSSAPEPRGNSRSQPTRQPGMLASYHQPGNRSGNTRRRCDEVRGVATSRWLRSSQSVAIRCMDRTRRHRLDRLQIRAGPVIDLHQLDRRPADLPT